MTIYSNTIGYCFPIVFENNRLLLSLLFCNLKIPKQGVEMQTFFLNGLWKFLKNGHLPVKLHSSAPRGLNSCCYLSKQKLSDCLHHSVPLDCLNLRPTSSVSENTQYLPTQSGDLERFNYDNDLSSVMSNFNLDDIKYGLPRLSEMISLETCLVDVRYIILIRL